jgi:hypothetical protein
MYDSDSGLEFMDPAPFGNPAPPFDSFANNATPAAPLTSANRSLPFIVAPLQQPRWPRDFFAVDIVRCFEEIENGATEDRVQEAFENHFGKWVPFVRATFYEHRKRWAAGTHEAKDAVLSADRTIAGCWHNFMLTTPSPRVQIKSKRQRDAQEQIKRLKPEVIDLSSDPESQA